MANVLVNNPVVRFWRTVIGPAAIMAAGMIGAGAVSTRLLAGTWFGFDLLWVALYVIPMVIFANDSASRVGILTGHRGMMEMIKTEISPFLAWFILVPTLLLNVVVNMSQMSVMIESVYGILGVDLPAGGAVTTGKIITVVCMIIFTLLVVLFGGFKRLTKSMTVFLMIILVCFIIVAIKGLLNPNTWIGLVKGLIPNIPPDVQVVGSDNVRSGFTQLMGIAGQALPASVFLSFGYFTSNAAYTEGQLKENLKKSIINFGYIWGAFSVTVVVAGTTALHNVYTGVNGGLHWSQIDTVANASNVLAPALPDAIGYLAKPIFSIGLFAAVFTTLVSVAMMMTYFTLDILGKNWNYTEDNKAYKWLLALWIAVPSLIAPFWHLPGLVQAILAMAGNLILCPIAILIIIYFMNKSKYVGKYTAGAGRNIVLWITFAFSLVVVVYGIFNLLKKLGVI